MLPSWCRRWVGGPGKGCIQGLAGNDTIDGGGGKDRLEGGYGDDVMIGGADADTFVFAPLNSPGCDTISDFTVGVDHLEFSGIDSLWDLSFTQVGADTVIGYVGGEGSITLTGVNTDELLQHHLTDLLLV
jgi:Ca2+-binding RTX toxin-like protein